MFGQITLLLKIVRLRWVNMFIALHDRTDGPSFKMICRETKNFFVGGRRKIIIIIIIRNTIRTFPLKGKDLNNALRHILRDIHPG